MREAWEETGRADLEMMGSLGLHERDMADCDLDEIHRRYSYHPRCTGEPPDAWQHNVRDPSDGSTEPIQFEHCWARLPATPSLNSGHDRLIPERMARLAVEGATV